MGFIATVINHNIQLLGSESQPDNSVEKTSLRLGTKVTRDKTLDLKAEQRKLPKNCSGLHK